MRQACIALLVGVLVVIFSMRFCSRQVAPGSERPISESLQSSVVTEDPVAPEQILLRGRVLALSQPGLETEEGKQFWSLVESARDTELSEEQYATLRAAEAALLAGGHAQVVTQPSSIVLSGQSAAIEIAQEIRPDGAPRITLTRTLEMFAQARPDGAVDVRAALRTSRVTGEVEHLAADAGIPLGERALVQAQGIKQSGQTLIGARKVSPNSGLGRALVLFVKPTLIQPEKGEFIKAQVDEETKVGP